MTKWCLQTDLTDDRIYFVVYKTACHLVFRTVGPLLVLTVLNCCLAQSLRDVKRRRQRITGGGGGGSAHRKSPTSTAASSVAGRRGGRGGGKQRENITTMVVAVIFVFIVCELPDVALRLAVTAVNLQVSPLYCLFHCLLLLLLLILDLERAISHVKRILTLRW